eukprot:TRINITY_DN9873_c0_g1_i1.p1 TRINITY_DN9873_c0_g1~~TRINITY_DN9873_c0_g1_i1.p1  ORF type:complete len:149 (-),score=36.62 TRINITY_DN9873_c0_g1_i1:31-477(-)
MDVLYCEVCTLPPEYCSYSKKFSKCKGWLMKYVPDMYPDLVPEEGDNDDQDSDKIVITIVSRNKRKSITTITGVKLINRPMDDLLKLFRNKFACGVNAPTDDSVQLQGDFGEMILEVLEDDLDVELDRIWFKINDKEVPAEESPYFFD